MTSSSPARSTSSTSRTRSRVSNPLRRHWEELTDPFARNGEPSLLLFFLLLLRPLVSDPPDHGGLTELLPQAVDRALGMRGAAVEHVGVVGLRTLAERTDAGAHQAEGGAVDFPRQHLAGHRENLGRQLCRRCDRLRAGALAKLGGLQFQRDRTSGEVGILQP